MTPAFPANEFYGFLSTHMFNSTQEPDFEFNNNRGRICMPLISAAIDGSSCSGGWDAPHGSSN